ncbi:uncharacterized protein LOC143738627 isoform X2 [Siphateles boraxobius]|uniref:uncharacterized protein LOC143738627 isoform X2 n=1 Tax=Siphateles boraxobius TaxID=180520 RepID=UPI004064714F
MDGYSYFSSLWEKISRVISWWWRSSSSTPDPSESPDKHDIRKPAPASVPVVQEGNSPAQSPVNSHSVHQIPSQHYSPTDPEEIAEVEKIYLNVKCAGKSMEVVVFPREKISVLHKDACDIAEKKPEKMNLVYEGEILDVNERVCHYGLRGGTTLNLIHA